MLDLDHRTVYRRSTLFQCLSPAVTSPPIVSKTAGSAASLKYKSFAHLWKSCETSLDVKAYETAPYPWDL